MANKNQEKSLPLILVVDDDPIMRLAHTEMFKDMARIITCENTYDGEKLMRSERPALVLLDDIMPNCPTGLSLLEKAKKDEQLVDVPIIMVTASNKEHEILRGLRAGAAAYITKPINVGEIKKAVQDELEKHPKRVWLVTEDVSLAKEIEALFTSLKCDVVMAQNVDELDRVSAPDFILVATGRMQFDKLRRVPSCHNVPMLLIGEDEAEGEGVPAHSSFLCEPVEPQEIAMQAARLMRGSVF